MEITLTGRHLEITPAIRQYATEKVSKLMRYFDRILQIEVVTDKADNHSYEAELIVHVEHHEPFIARARSGDLYASVDEVVDKMERQLTDHKEKLRNRKHTGSRG